jgi:hypothetical protein
MKINIVNSEAHLLLVYLKIFPAKLCNPLLQGFSTHEIQKSMLCCTYLCKHSSYRFSLLRLCLLSSSLLLLQVQSLDQGMVRT